VALLEGSPAIAIAAVSGLDADSQNAVAQKPGKKKDNAVRGTARDSTIKASTIEAIPAWPDPGLPLNSRGKNGGAYHESCTTRTGIW